MCILTNKNFPKPINKSLKVWYNKYIKERERDPEKGGIKMKWTKVDEQYSNYSITSYEDYINEEGTMIRRVWNDGFVEEFEIEKE